MLRTGLLESLPQPARALREEQAAPDAVSHARRLGGGDEGRPAWSRDRPTREEVAAHAAGGHPHRRLLDTADRASTDDRSGAARSRCSSAPTPPTWRSSSLTEGESKARQSSTTVPTWSSPPTATPGCRPSSTAPTSRASTTRPFDDFLAERAARVEAATKLGVRNEQFAQKLVRGARGGPRGGWDAAQRDKELDADGVAGEVDLPGRRRRREPHRARRSASASACSGDLDPELGLAGAQAHNRWLAELCSRHRPSGAAASRWCRSPPTSTTCSPRSAGPRSPGSAR